MHMDKRDFTLAKSYKSTFVAPIPDTNKSSGRVVKILTKLKNTLEKEYDDDDDDDD